MKIQAIYLNHVGPIKNQKFDFYDDWSEKIISHVLFSGPNGSGKSIILKTIAELWQATGYWLDNRKRLPYNSTSNRKWLQQWGGIAVILTELPEVSTPVGLVFGDRAWFNQIKSDYSDIQWIGEVMQTQSKGTTPRNLFLPSKLLHRWSQARNQLLLTFEAANTPNVIYLDAEECRWVSPKRRLGKILPEDSGSRWLVKYKVTEDWQGQLEASIVNLKLAKKDEKYKSVIFRLNRFLSDKEIDPEIKLGENRLQVIIKGKPNYSHAIDDLSTGERQVLIKLYLVSRWLEPGGIVMIDEPDLYLHPSLVSSFLAQLEALVEEQQGQLLITSHLPSVWSRYEAQGKRIQLGGTS
jgi:predicted ATPase